MSSPTPLDPSDNPYAAPRAEIGRAAARPIGGPGSEAEQIRLRHLPHESNVYAIAGLLGPPGVFALISGLGFLATGTSLKTILSLAAWPGQPALAIAQIAMGALWIASGRGLVNLAGRARLGAILSAIVFMAAITALFACDATLRENIARLQPRMLLFASSSFGIGAIMSWLLSGLENRIIFAEDYRQVVRSTPHIRPKGGVLGRILFILYGIIFFSLMFNPSF